MTDRREDDTMGRSAMPTGIADLECKYACSCPPVHLHPQRLQQIFDEEIVGLHLGKIIPQEQPKVLYLNGQPGSGKTTIAKRIIDAQAVGQAARICADDLKQFHPRYEELMQHNSRTAGTRIRIHLKAWQKQIEQFLAQRRAHVVIEISPGEPEEFFRSAAVFHAHGYQIKLVTLAVRASDSFQGVAARFAETWTPDMPARFTSRQGHHQCFTAVADTLQQAEHTAMVDSIMIVDRQGRPLWSARHRHHMTASQALVKERDRPYTLEEAIEFVKTQERLRDELPGYRHELDEIDRLAWALLPDDLRFLT